MFEKLDTNGKDLQEEQQEQEERERACTTLPSGITRDGYRCHPMLIVKLTVFGALTTKAS